MEHAIAKRAYELWVDAGKPDGRDWEFWMRAEQQIMDERRRVPPLHYFWVEDE